MRNIFLCTFLLMVIQITAQPVLRFEDNQTLRYEEVIDAYRYYANNYPQARLLEMGPSDAGEPIHLFLIGHDVVDQSRSIAELARGNAVLLINNGIHPGESCGIDASLLLVDSLIKSGIPDSLLIAIIPVYNVGGALNRNSGTRANQNGPVEHGFRGNARYLDLNRDFIKADALNTFSFYAIFHSLKPQILVDTHTSNGADYQYVMTLLSTQKDKLNPVLSQYMTLILEPFLYRQMAEKDYPMTPYVNVFGAVPNEGFNGFMDSPRYSGGYAALFHSIAFTTEAHMLKPYPQRVWATYHFLRNISGFMADHAGALIQNQATAFEYDLKQASYPLSWELDPEDCEQREFAGYGYAYLPSEVHGGQRLRYNAADPQTFSLPFCNNFAAVDSAQVPRYYLIPQAWREVVLRLQSNNVEMIPLANDSSFEVEQYRMADPEFLTMPYEGHFPLRKISVEKEQRKRSFRRGDWLIPTDQPGRRFLVNTLEPLATDAYLRWNFFDAVFQQKEYFSSYVFEDTAAELLKDDPALQKAYDRWQMEHPELKDNGRAALDFIYKQSKHYEPDHLVYPVYRLP